MSDPLTVDPPIGSTWGTRVRDYSAIVKPKIALMVLVAVSAGYFLAPQSGAVSGSLWSALVGVALVAVASNALNQWYERDTDARMRRTADRGLPSGRLSSLEVALFGTVCGLVGVGLLAVQVNALTAGLAAMTLVVYTAVYTPLKRTTALATAIGAVPGAMPPVLGWTAATGTLDAPAFALFAMLFLWQFPHFLAIAWIHREDYSAAGLRMLPAEGRVPGLVGLVAVGYAVVLIPASLTLVALGYGGMVYAAVAAVLGVAYLVASGRFAMNETKERARQILWTSLAYLPLVLATLVWEHWQSL
jgi:protoheme IX farnesyltransferase